MAVNWWSNDASFAGKCISWFNLPSWTIFAQKWFAEKCDSQRQSNDASHWLKTNPIAAGSPWAAARSVAGTTRSRHGRAWLRVITPAAPKRMVIRLTGWAGADLRGWLVELIYYYCWAIIGWTVIIILRLTMITTFWLIIMSYTYTYWHLTIIMDILLQYSPGCTIDMIL